MGIAGANTLPRSQTSRTSSFKVAFSARPDIVLRKIMRGYVGKKAKFAQLLQELIGIQPGDELIDWLAPDPKNFDVKEANKKLRRALNGMEVLMTTKYDPAKETPTESGYTNNTDLKALTIASGSDDLSDVPLQANPSLQKEPLTPAQQAAEADSLHDSGVPARDELDEDLPF